MRKDTKWGKASQAFLRDVSEKNRVRPWREKRMKSEQLMLAYAELNSPKAARLRQCARVLRFKVRSNGRRRLVGANFCRVRLCPMCAWRRSLKTYSNVRKVMAAMEPEGYAYLFLTLTVKNVEGDRLSETLDAMFKAWRLFMGYKAVAGVVKGWMRSLEVTHNVDRASASYDTYHPHFHVLVAVRESYFSKAGGYLSQKAWVALWRKAMRLDYDPSVRVQRVKGKTAKAVAELSKYAVKDEDYLDPSDWEMTVETVRVLDAALDHRRLLGYGGVMRELHRKLNLEDEERGSLVRVGEDNEWGDDALAVEEVYVWHAGYRQYVRMKSSL